MNLKRKLSFFTAAAMAVSMLPAVSAGAATESLTNRESVYSLSEDTAAEWEYDSSASFTVNGMTATNTGSNNRPVWYYFSDTSYTGERYLEIEFTLSMTSAENDSTFSIAGAESGSTTDDNAHAVIRLVHDKSSKSLVLQDAKTNTYTLMTSSTTTVSAKIHAVMDFNLKTYDITAYSTTDGSELCSYTDMMFYDESMTTITGVYSRLAHTNGSVTLSDLTIYKKGAAELNKSLYDLTTDVKDSTAANATSWGGNTTMVSTSNDDATINNIVFTGSINGARSSYLSFTESSQDYVNANFNIAMRFDSNGLTRKVDNAYVYEDYEQYFAIKASKNSASPVFELRVHSTYTNGYTITVNGNDITENIKDAVTDSTGFSTTETLSVWAGMNFETHEVTVYIGQFGTETAYIDNVTYAMLDTEATAVSYAECSIGRSETASMNTTLYTLTITEDGTQEPVIIPTFADTSENPIKIPVGETLCIASAELYDTLTATINVTSGSDIADVEAVEYLGTVLVTGKATGTAAVTVTAVNQNGYPDNSDYHKSVSETIYIEIIESTAATAPPKHATALADTEDTTVVNIDFDAYGTETDDDTAYKIRDEYGRTQPESEDNDSQSWTKIADTSSNENDPIGLTTGTGTDISGKAFYSWLTPNTGVDETGNGYRGSRLILDNEMVQRTDKIHVSYDFAIYNKIAEDNYDENGNTLETATKIGTPVAVTMTSETAEAGSIPHQFNTLSYREIDSDPSDLATVSQHLLTFMTGRPKRDSDGIHWTDMTNKLAYYSPAYGRYVATNISLTENAYNYFHVEADVDFYDRELVFTITRTDISDADGKTFNQTIFIPENASWNGFIISSNKYDTNSYSDVKGQDTEHYAYLDNIKAEKTHEDQAYINPLSMPTEHPLPVDAVAFSSNKAHGISKGISSADTWSYDTAYEIIPPYTGGELNYVSYTGESVPMDFTFYIATNNNTGTSTTGITTYTEFDFYLPKEGSGITLLTNASRSGSLYPGSAITISTAGINSWRGNTNYELIYGDRLECGKWYNMQLVFDHNESNIQVIVKDETGASIADSTVSSRSLNPGYYRSITFNPSSITTGGDDTVTFPAKEPSMALTYIANLRVYNRAALREYYPEGTTTDALGNAYSSDSQTESTLANSSRLGSRLTDFTKDEVGTNVNSPTFTAADNSAAIVPPDKAGYTFTGWKLIYSNGTDAVIGENESEGTDATRLKYAATYTEDPTDTEGTRSHVTAENGMYYMLFEATLPIPDSLAPYDSIKWTTYQSENEKMTGIWKINWGETLPTASGDGGIVFGYGIYKIPRDIDSSTISVSAHAGFGLSQDGITYDGGTGAEDDSTYKAAASATEEE